jgi:hypothetical protein
MKIKYIVFAAIAICLGGIGYSQSSRYQSGATFWNFSAWTNVPGDVTNVSVAMDCTTLSDFALGIVAIATNNTGGAGSLDVVWETSVDGNNWPMQTNALLNNVGWFSIPLQSNHIMTCWGTNITVNAIGYWRVRHITNKANICFTNLNMWGHIKPTRQYSR